METFEFHRTIRLTGDKDGNGFNAENADGGPDDLATELEDIDTQCNCH